MSRPPGTYPHAMDRTRARRNPRRGYTGAKENLFGQPCRNGPNGPNGPEHGPDERAGRTGTAGPDGNGRENGQENGRRRTGSAPFAGLAQERGLRSQPGILPPGPVSPVYGPSRCLYGLFSSGTVGHGIVPFGPCPAVRPSGRSGRAGPCPAVGPFGRRTVGSGRFLPPSLPSVPIGQTQGVAREASGRCACMGACAPGRRPSCACVCGRPRARVPEGVGASGRPGASNGGCPSHKKSRPWPPEILTSVL